MRGPTKISREVVLVGGGHTHALVLRAWAMAPVEGARLTVINPAPTAPYTGMLPGHIAGHYPRDALEIDLVRLSNAAGARLILGYVTDFDMASKRIAVPGRPDIHFDLASIDIGITSDMPTLPGFQEHGIGAKPLGPFADRWAAHLQSGGGPVAVIGGGIAGVELALAMRHAMGPEHPVTIVDRSTALSDLGAARAPLLQTAADAGVTLVEGTSVSRVEADYITLENGDQIPAQLTVGAAGARPHKWLSNTDLPLKDGYIVVDRRLSVGSWVYAVGDCAHLSHAPRPKAGVFAVRAAPILLANLRADLTGQPRRVFDPQKDYLKLVSLGDKRALAIKWNRAIGGAWAWRWKDRIDQSFMTRLNTPPKMQAKPPATHVVQQDDNAPLCGGCGSKVGADTLDTVLSQPGSKVVGAGDDAAVVDIDGTRVALTTDHLRALWADPWVMAQIAVHHALGDIWAMGARPEVALAQITLPHLDNAQQPLWLGEVMDGIQQALGPTGAQVVGGHTSMGAEMQIGFTLTGRFEDEPRAQGGAQEGDAIVLTRPIGSGVLLAAMMKGRGKGNDIASLLASMTTSQSDAADILRPIANAMTDVTGFGLAGHLIRMARASDKTVLLTLSNVPLYDGAEALALSGYRSTIWPANRALFDGADLTDPRFDLLFDPQTCGGLLASVPSGEASTCVARLREAGHQAASIGTFAASGPKRLKVL